MRPLTESAWPLRSFTYAVATLLLVGIGVWGVMSLRPQPSRMPEAFTSPEERQAAEGRDEAERSEDVLGSYSVAADRPRLIVAQSIGLEARILPMGVNPDNSMQAPINVFDSGWYVGSAKPGDRGAMVINGHASGPTRQGLFANIDMLEHGARITVERGDGEVFAYRVVHTEVAPVKDIDMRRLLRPYGDADSGLNLITCSGTWLEGQKTYDQRTMVYAELVK